MEAPPPIAVSVLSNLNLLSTILAFLPIQTHGRMVLLCRAVFPAAASVLWAHVYGVETLVGILFPEPIPPCPQGTRSVPSITFPNEFPKEKWARFWIYAKYVITLEVQLHPGQGYRWENFEPLFKHLRERPAGLPRVLTPWLYQLTITRRAGGNYSSQLASWLKLLCSSSCHKMRVNCASFIDVPWLRGGDLAIVAKAISEQSCPLYDLALWSYKDLTPAIHLEFCNALGTLLQLKQLGLGIEMLDSTVLEVMGSLPKLCDLTIRGLPHMNHTFANTIVGNTGFRALRQLHVYNVRAGSLKELFRLRPLLRYVSTVDCVIAQFSEQEDHLPEVFSLLGQQPDSLKQLSLAFDEPSLVVEIESIHLASLFRHRQLTYLRISGARMRNTNHCAVFHNLQPIGPPEAPLERPWRQLREVRWPLQPATNDDLRQFCHIPTLKTLCLDFSLRPVDPIEDDVIIPVSPLCLRLECKFQMIGFSPEEVDNYARFLLGCWNGLEPIIVGRTFNLRSERDVRNALWYTMLLNQLSRLTGRPVTDDTIVWRAEGAE